MADHLPNSNYKLGVSIVIATLGEEVLNQTLRSISTSSVLPDEILICIPTKFKDKVKNLENSHIKIIETSCTGQVAQRAIGFNLVENKFVMQLDDDITLDHHCIEFLLASCNSEKFSSIAPSLILNSTGRSIYAIGGYKKYLRHLYSLIINGRWQFNPGSVDKSGTPFGVDPGDKQAQVKGLDWLAGGCIMHRKENLILYNFYPFSGKAYGEDIIHSYLLRAKGINLIMDPRAKCGVEIAGCELEPMSLFFKTLKADLRVRRYYMSLNKSKSFRAYIYYIGMIVIYFCKKLNNFL